ncbi:MAG: hypothetical protein PF636_02595 [Actinomycetota bacterium]|jgi:hypothetical protein|nr:hypothetical protein [Actinomycetota bacterium]
MKRKKMTVLLTGALTAVLVLGGIGYAFGETVDDASTEAGWLGGAMHRAGGGLAEIVADLTGLDVTDVHDRRADGESLAAIAESEGVGTADIKDAAVADFETSLDERLTSTEPLPEGRMGRGGMMGRPGEVRPESVLADLTDLDISEIHDLRVAGQSLADIAADQGVDIDDVVATVIASAEENLQAAVDDDRMDADQKTEILDNLSTHLDEIVNSTDVPVNEGMGGPRGGHGAPGQDAPPAEAGISL